MVGAGIAKAGVHVVNLDVLQKTAVFIVYSPLLGLLLAFVLIVLVMWLVHRSRSKRRVNRTFRSCSWCRRQRSASVTAPTMRRRRWASSRRCWSVRTSSMPAS